MIAEKHDFLTKRIVEVFKNHTSTAALRPIFWLLANLAIKFVQNISDEESPGSHPTIAECAEIEPVHNIVFADVGAFAPVS